MARETGLPSNQEFPASVSGVTGGFVSRAAGVRKEEEEEKEEKKREAAKTVMKVVAVKVRALLKDADNWTRERRVGESEQERQHFNSGFQEALEL